MLYSVVKIWIRIALKFFCREIVVSDPSFLQAKGPLLLACNHPDSFFDAIIIGSFFKRPVHFLARGDAFRRPFAKKILTKLKLIPIYRLSEGREYLALNDATFERCREILQEGGIVLIFAEGLCVNQWMLRSLKKGAARITLAAWKNPAIGEQFRVLPVSLNYNTFREFGKRVIINFGIPISKKDFSSSWTEGEYINEFNSKLSERLKLGMLESADNTSVIQMLISNQSLLREGGKQTIQSLKIKQRQANDNEFSKIVRIIKSPYLITTNPVSATLNFFGIVFLLVPAIAGLLLHAPLYLPINSLVKSKTEGTVFFDSVMFGLLMVSYPIYWLILNFAFLLITNNSYARLILLLTPVFGYIYLVWKDCCQRVLNYFALNVDGRKYIKKIFS